MPERVVLVQAQSPLLMSKWHIRAASFRVEQRQSAGRGRRLSRRQGRRSAQSNVLKALGILCGHTLAKAESFDGFWRVVEVLTCLRLDDRPFICHRLDPIHEVSQSHSRQSQER
jgi:hypothetical protein